MERAPLQIFANRSGLQLGRGICANLAKLRRQPCKVNRIFCRPGIEQFACGEFKVTLEDSVRGRDVFLVQCAVDPACPSRSIQDNLWESLQALETIRFCHASHITLVMPCLPYSRQDKRSGRESCSAMLLAKLISKAGADAIITIDLHANQIKGFYEALDVKPDALYATKIFTRYLHQKYNLTNMVVLSPDEGSAKRARIFAQMLFKEPEDKMEERLVYTIKDRRYDISNKVRKITILGDVRDKDVLIVDNIFDTCSTAERAMLAARECGAKKVILCGPHAILSDPAAQRLDSLFRQGVLRELLTTDSVMQHPEYNREHPWYKQFTVAPLLASMINQINKESETSSLYS